MADYSVNYAINVVDNGSKGLQSFQASAEKVLKMMKPFQNLTRTIDKLNASLGKISSKSFKVNVNASGATKSVGLLNKQLAALERRLGTLSAPHNIVVNTSMNGATGTGRGAAAVGAATGTGTGRGTVAPAGASKGSVGFSPITPYRPGQQPGVRVPINVRGASLNPVAPYAPYPGSRISPMNMFPGVRRPTAPPSLASRVLDYGGNQVMLPGRHTPAMYRPAGSMTWGVYPRTPLPWPHGVASRVSSPISVRGGLPYPIVTPSSSMTPYTPLAAYGVAPSFLPMGKVPPKLSYATLSPKTRALFSRPASFRARYGFGGLSGQVLGNTRLDSGGIGIGNMLKGMGIMYGITGVGSLMGQAIKDVSEWDDTMIAVKSLLKVHDTRPEKEFEDSFNKMQRNIRDVGVLTKFTAPEVGNAARFFAMTGYNADDISNSMLAVADLATFGGEDIGMVADKMTNIMSAFGIKSKDARMVADILGNAISMGNTDLFQLSEAMKFAAGPAAGTGQNLAMLAAAIPILGDRGIQAGNAGRGLRRMFLEIAAPKGKKKEAWDALGIDRFDKNNNLKPIMQIVEELNNNKVKFATPDGKNALTSLFGVQGAAAIQALMKDYDKFKLVYDENLKAANNGFTAPLAEERRKSLPNQWAQIQSAFVDQSMDAYAGVRKPVEDLMHSALEWMKSEDAAHAIKTFAEGLLDLLKVTKDVTMYFVGLYEKFGPMINAFLKFQLVMMPVLTTLRAFKSLIMLGSYLKIMAVGIGAVGRSMAALGIGIRNVVAQKQPFMSMMTSWDRTNGYSAYKGVSSTMINGRRVNSDVAQKYYQRYGAWQPGFADLRQSVVPNLGAVAGGVLGGYLGSNIGEPGSVGQILGMGLGSMAGMGLGQWGGSKMGAGISKGAGWLWRNKKIAGGAGAAALAMYLGYKALQSRGENSSGVENEASGSGLAAMATMMALPMLPKALDGVAGLFTKGGGLITLAFSNPVMTAITALTVALAAFTALNWDDIKSFFTGEEKTGKFTTRVIKDKDGNIISEETLPEGANTAFGRAKEESLRRSLYENPDGTYDYAHRYLFGENGSTAAAVEQYIANLFGGNTLLDVRHSQTEGWGFGDIHSLSEIWQDQLNGWKEAWQTAKTWASTKWNELMSGIEELLAPIWVPMKSAIGSIGERIASVWSKITEWIPTKIREIWQGLVAKFPILGEMGDFLSGLVKPSSAPSSGSQVTTQYPGGPYNLTNTKKLNEGFNTKKQSNESQDEKGYNQGWKPMSRNEGSLINIENINVNGDGTFDTAALEREMINVFTRCVNSSGLLYGQGHTV